LPRYAHDSLLITASLKLQVKKIISCSCSVLLLYSSSCDRERVCISKGANNQDYSNENRRMASSVVRTAINPPRSQEEGQKHAYVYQNGTYIQNFSSGWYVMNASTSASSCVDDGNKGLKVLPAPITMTLPRFILGSYNYQCSHFSHYSFCLCKTLTNGQSFLLCCFPLLRRMRSVKKKKRRWSMNCQTG
jgi:hypothetical protein